MKTLHPFARQLALADGRKCGMKTRSRGQNSVAVVGLESGPLLLTIGSFRLLGQALNQSQP